MCAILQLVSAPLNPVAVQTFIIEKIALFFCQHAQNQCDIVKRTHFAVPTPDTVSDKNNFKSLLYNLLYGFFCSRDIQVFLS